MTRFFLAAGLLALQTATAFAVADGPDHYRVVGVARGDVLNIRAAPSARAPILGTIPFDGDGVRNMGGCEGGLSIDEWARATAAERLASMYRRWCRVEYDGVSGWVAGRYLREGNAPR